MIFIFIFIWLRGTLPRLRYDQFMAFGWKRLIPISLVWIVAVAAIRAISLEGGIDRSYLLGAIGVVAVLFLVLFFVGEKRGGGRRGASAGRGRAGVRRLRRGLPGPADARPGAASCPAEQPYVDRRPPPPMGRVS